MLSCSAACSTYSQGLGRLLALELQLLLVWKMRIYYKHKVGKWEKRLLTLRHKYDVVGMEDGGFGFKITARYKTISHECIQDSANEISADVAYELLGEDLAQILAELKSGEMWGKK